MLQSDKSSTDNFYYKAIAILSFLIIALGVAVLTGWYTHNMMLIQVFPGFAPMQYNTALCFLLTGIALLFIYHPETYITKIAGAGVVAIGFLTLMEFIFVINIGLDSLFMAPYAFTEALYPGRMAPNTALGFFLTGIALLFCLRDKRLMQSLAGGIAVISLLSFFTYAAEGTDIYRWDAITRMSLHATAGFFVVSLCMLAYAAQIRNMTPFNIWDTAPTASFVILIIVTFFCWHASKELVSDSNRQQFHDVINDAESTMRERFKIYEHVLYSGASLILASEEVTRNEWKTYVSALRIRKNLPGILNIGFIDYLGPHDQTSLSKNEQKNTIPAIPADIRPDRLRMRYAEPAQHESASIALNIKSEKILRAAATKAMKTGEAALTRKIQLDMNEERQAGFFLLVPVYETPDDDTQTVAAMPQPRRILGWVYATLLAESFFSNIDDFIEHSLNFSIYDGEKAETDNIIFKTAQSLNLSDPNLVATTKIEIADSVWTATWQANQAFYPAQSYAVPGIILLIGLMITALVSGFFLMLARIYGNTTQTLSDSKERLRAIVENAVDGLITINDRGTIDSVNPACERIFGYAPAEMIGKNVKILMPEPYHGQHDQYLSNYHNTGVKKIIGIGREVEGRRKDGSVFPLDLSVCEVSLFGRRFYSGIVRDISARKKAEEEIMRSNLELSRFAYVASHDLREPLRMISSFTGLLQEEYQDRLDQQGLQYMRYIVDASQRMQTLINDLLEYSRTHSETGAYDNVDCNRALDMALENLRASIDESAAKITADDLPQISGSQIQFTRLLQNLIGNAIKYQNRERKPEIHVGVKQSGDDWLFSVSDNGIGMRKEYLEQIFTIFTRLHNKNEYPGTGIGLAICRKIAESHGGHIWAESTPGEGSVFYFTVPAKERQKDAA